MKARIPVLIIDPNDLKNLDYVFINNRVVLASLSIEQKEKIVKFVNKFNKKRHGKKHH